MKKKILTVLIASVISTSISPAIGVYANELKEDKNVEQLQEEETTGEKTASVSRFDVFYTKDREAYDAKFRMENSNIAKITNNAGNYASSVIANAVDNNINTHWETNKPNSDSFTNEVVIELKEETALDRIAYKGRGGNKGFAQEFEIWGSTNENEEFELVADGKANVTSDVIEIKFKETKFKKIKFVFKKANQNWAAAGEFMFYKKDELTQTMSKLFTDGLQTKLSDEFNSNDAITKLEKQLEGHPFKYKYEKDVKLARDLINNPNKFENVKIITAEQRGKYGQETNKRSINGNAYSSFQSTGLYVTAGEEFEVFVEADKNGILPRICFGQVGVDIGGWTRWTNLKVGRNVIKAPENINTSAIYIVNDALPKDQKFAPKLRLEGGSKFPRYVHGETNPDEFFSELKEYSKKIEFSDEAFKNGNPEGKVFNIAEFVSDNVVITTSAMGAIEGLKEAEKKGYNISDTMDGWEQMYDMFQKFMGFEKDAKEEKHSYFPNKFIARVFKNVPLGFADHGYTGYLGSNNEARDGGFFKLIAMPPQMPGNDNWAYTHEFGHIFNTRSIVHGEVTNNLYAQEYRRINNIGGDRANWNGILKRFKGEEVTLSHFENLAILSQLNIAYGYDVYTKASIAVRDNEQLIKSIKGSELRRLAVAYSIGVGENLLDFFEGWNYTDITPEMEEAVKHLPKPTRKIEYLHGGAYDYEGQGFNENLELEVNMDINEENKTNNLTFKIDNENKDDLLGFEILKNGEVIGFTKDYNFTVKDIDTSKNETYEIVAYAKNLKTSEKFAVNTFTPVIKFQQEKMFIGLNEEFNPMDYTKGLSHKGEDISSKVKIESDVDTSKKGEYTVKYTLVDEGITVEKIMKVEVVSSFDYLSDKEWTDVQIQYGTPRRNKDIKGRVNGDIKIFEKGFGIHANGKIIYDMSNLDYDNFEALLGVDMGLQAQDNSSISFKIIADGEVLAKTGVLKHADDMEYVNVPIKGVKELVIEIDSAGNGNTSDHGIIANPKLTTNDSKPSINLEDKTYKIGDKVDISEGVTAKDVEDGDLTSSLEVVSNSYKEGQVGRFEVVYRVTDSDKNSVEKKKFITVYEDYNVVKSKYGEIDGLNEYNNEFKIPVASVSNNGGNYGNSVIKNAVDGDLNSHWETGNPNNASFNNEVIFDLGESKEISKIAYAARRGGKGFASKFEIYVSDEESGNDFILAGKGQYKGNVNDVATFEISKTQARRVKFKFIEANQNWASLGEVSFYKEDILADKINKELFIDEAKTKVNEKYDSLEKLEVLKEEVKNHVGYKFFEVDLNKAEEIIKSKFPTLDIAKSISTKVGQPIDISGGFTATDSEDGDLTSKVVVTGDVNFNRPGKYTQTYTITDSDGNKTVKTRTVAVVNMQEYSYLTNYDWASIQNSYSAPKKDISTSGRALRLTKEDGSEAKYEKGIGAHSTSTIIYDLTDKNYVYFTSYVGVDRQMFGTVGQVSFEVYVDGEKKFDSGVMTSRDAQKFVEVDINDAKELKLVVTEGGNGNGSDHATWGDTKLHSATSNVNKDKLDEELAQIEKLDESLYTVESWNNLINVKNEAIESLKDGYTQEEVDTLYQKLIQAKESLERNIDKSELQEKLEYANTIDITMVGATTHIEARWNNFEEAKKMAKDCLDDNTKTQEEVDSVNNFLQYCIEELYLKEA